MSRPMATEPVPKYDWRGELGVVPDPPAPRSGETRSAHPLTKAMNRGGAVAQRAQHVIEHALKLAEGRIAHLGEILDCHYNTARRLIEQAQLLDMAGTLRFEHQHAGPTGLGIQPRADRRRRQAERDK